MKTNRLMKNRIAISSFLLFFTINSFGQNVFDSIIATSPNHTYLEAALIQEELDDVLRDVNAEYTVFAPTDSAFLKLADALNTDLDGLLALENLSDILLYHVLDSEVLAAAINNGDVVDAISTTNTLKLTKKGNGDVFVNQAQVTTANVTSGNGVVHVVNEVLLPWETVVDIALDNGFSTLATAVITAELLPALTNPLAELTVFAPTNEAFNNLATALDTDIAGLLALENLADILTYHVLGSEVLAADVTNGAVVEPLSTTNTLKLTKKGNGDVFVNQAQVTATDITSDNGVVHVLDAVVLPSETVVDIALDNGFSTLATAVITAELLPALTNPFAELTVFAPTNEAFDNLATALETDLDGILALDNLSDILLYHVVSGRILSSDLTNGEVVTLSGENISIDITGGVVINESNVTTADIEADNGVVHVIDAVLLANNTSLISELSFTSIDVYPNPATEVIILNDVISGNFKIYSANGNLVQDGIFFDGRINVSTLSTGSYLLNAYGNNLNFSSKFIKK